MQNQNRGLSISGFLLYTETIGTNNKGLGKMSDGYLISVTSETTWSEIRDEIAEITSIEMDEMWAKQANKPKNINVFVIHKDVPYDPEESSAGYYAFGFFPTQVNGEESDMYVNPDQDGEEASAKWNKSDLLKYLDGQAILVDTIFANEVTDFYEL